MKRERIQPRPNWQEIHRKLRFSEIENSWGGGYWNEGAAYHFSESQIRELRDATQRLHDMCMQALETIIKGGNYYERFDLPEEFIPYIEKTWKRGDPSLYGRFDLAYDGKTPPTMLEYNADAAGTLYEASILQRQWLQAQPRSWNQFNLIHEQLVNAWKKVNSTFNIPKLYFANDYDNEEDTMTADYLLQTAEEAGLAVEPIGLGDIRWNEEFENFTDTGEDPIQCLYMYYPWEFIVRDEFAKYIMNDTTGFMEPAYSMLLTSKAILSVLWEQNPEHRNLLPTFMDADKMTGAYVKKPIWGQEGGGISIISDEFNEKSANDGYVGEDWGKYVYQQYVPLPEFDGKTPIIGSFAAGGKACGIGIREGEKITTTEAQFVPHYFTKTL
ncbi:MAG: glutathionylspermidine synthase family protein [Chloroflexi bacterium]|nr:glutathionylspermidine synthase family protein [Chloroflexota bacterium]